MLDCDCPRCGSAKTMTFSALHQNGVRLSEYRTSGLFYYRRSFGVQASRTRGRSQTLNSVNATPPVPPTTRFLTGAGVPVTLLIGVWIGAVPGFWVAFGLLVALAVAGGRRDAKSWGDEHQLWSSTFRCSRCGTVFAVVESEMESTHANPAH